MINAADASFPPHRKDDYFPTVSIIIPVYNGMSTIRLCLDAVTRLNYPRDRYEVIVVDNNSMDGTPDVVKQYPVHLVYEREIQGPHAATNTGVRISSGEILAFTDSDCVPDKEWLHELVKPFRDEQVVCAGGRLEAYQPQSRVERFIDQMKPLKNGVQLTPCFPMAFITANAAFRHADFINVGMFNSNMYTGAEVDLSYRIQFESGKCGIYVPEALVLHKFSPKIRALARHCYIYGYGEILLATTYKDYPEYPWTPRKEVKIIAQQFVAIFIYIASLIYRTLTFLWRPHADGDLLWWPILWIIAEGSNLRGKFEGLAITRFCKYKFWEKKVRVI